MMVEKRCTHCGTTKTAAEFGVNRVSGDGLQSWCKACRIQANKERWFARRREDPEFRERLNRTARDTRNPLRVRRDVARDRARRKIVGTPEWARYQVQRAVSRGKLVKPAKCDKCQAETPKASLDGHHWHGDYAGRPLDVEWLCSLCHGACHREEAVSQGDMGQAA